MNGDTITNNGTRRISLSADRTADFVDLKKIVHSTFGRWLEEQGHTLDSWSGRLVEKGRAKFLQAAPHPIGSDRYLPEHNTVLLDVVINQYHYDEVFLPGVSLAKLILSAAEGEPIAGQPIKPLLNGGKFWPKPRSVEELRAEAREKVDSELAAENIDLLLKLATLSQIDLQTIRKFTNSLNPAEEQTLRETFQKENEQ